MTPEKQTLLQTKNEKLQVHGKKTSSPGARQGCPKRGYKYPFEAVRRPYHVSDTVGAIFIRRSSGRRETKCWPCRPLTTSDLTSRAQYPRVNAYLCPDQAFPALARP